MKKTLLSLLIINLSVMLFALPGFNSFIQDKAGEFVYYKDSSFERESYIGLLSYDANTFQIRYYAPANASNGEKIVACLFTIDSGKDSFDMTGENVIIADYNNEEDVEIVNYMHDLLYEFSTRRINLGPLHPKTQGYINNTSLTDNGLKVKNNYPQFGGDVVMVYDCMIPYFNLKRIEDPKGKAIFECVEIGKISSTEDTLFDRYVKLPDVGNLKVNSVKPKKQKAFDAVIGNQKIKLDASWEAKMSNMWVQNDDAIITMVTYDNPAAPDYYNEYSILRSLLESKDGYYITLDKCDVIFDKGNLRIYSEQYLGNAGKLYYGIKYLTLNSDNQYDYLSFAALKATYLIKRSYYDKIIKTYSN
ncbi:MAG: hypothetical protein K6C97_02760 [Treponema sp.]|nr:hypothetical protein [Treponema sp.]